MCYDNKLIGFYNKSVILTYLGVAMSICGIVNIMNGYMAYEESVDRVPLSMVCFILAGICDLFDGYIARRCKRTEQEKEFGIQIDSLSDVVSFLVFPVVILCRLCYKHYLLMFVCIVYVLCGIIRLAYFNVTIEDNIGFYRGLPVTFSALIIPVVYTIVKLCNIHNIENIILITYFLISVSFIVNFKIKKTTGIWYLIFSVLAILTISIILFT